MKKLIILLLITVLVVGVVSAQTRTDRQRERNTTTTADISNDVSKAERGSVTESPRNEPRVRSERFNHNHRNFSPERRQLEQNRRNFDNRNNTRPENRRNTRPNQRTIPNSCECLTVS